MTKLLKAVLYSALIVSVVTAVVGLMSWWFVYALENDFSVVTFLSPLMLAMFVVLSVAFYSGDR